MNVFDVTTNYFNCLEKHVCSMAPNCTFNKFMVTIKIDHMNIPINIVKLA